MVVAYRPERDLSVRTMPPGETDPRLVPRPTSKWPMSGSGRGVPSPQSPVHGQGPPSPTLPRGEGMGGGAKTVDYGLRTMDRRRPNRPSAEGGPFFRSAVLRRATFP